MPTITAFKTSPDKGAGLARDMRVRWALEEVGCPYDVQLVTFDELKQPAHLKRQPFGQIPTYEYGNVVLFESGASFTSRKAVLACCLTMRRLARKSKAGCSLP